MVARQWRGLARASDAAAYEDHLRGHTFPALRRISGFVDASILRRRVERGVEFVIVTRWASMQAIEGFAGPDVEAAVVPVEVEALMLEYDRRVNHFEVVE